MLAVLLMAPFLAQVDATVVNVATPAIQRSLGASAAAVELVIGGYLISYAVLMITGARLGQTHGYHRLFLLGVSAFGLTSLIGGLAPNATVLVVMRFLQGVGAALMYPQTLTGIQLNFAGPARARAISLLALALAGGAVCGQILGGSLIAADIAGTGWRAIFLINIPICAAVIITAARYLPANHQLGSARVDLPGVATLTASLLLIVLPLIVGRAMNWPVWTWVCLVASVPAFGAFLSTQRREARRGGHPLLNLHILSRPAISWGLLSMLIATGTYYALLFVLAQYLQQGIGHSALFSGLVLLPWVSMFGLAGQLTRRLPSRLSPLVPGLGYAVMASAYLVIGLTVLTGALPDILLLVLLGAGGLGLGTGFNTLVGYLTSVAPARYAPDVSGAVGTTLLIGGSLGVATLGTLYLALAAWPAPDRAGVAFAVTSLALACASLLAAAAAHLATHRCRSSGGQLWCRGRSPESGTPR